MRLSLLFAAALLATAASAARACDALVIACPPPVVLVPAYTPEGIRVGTVEAPVRLPRALELSPYTGQPITVVYNDPARLPGSVVPDLALVPLPRAGHFHTRAVYPRGY